MCDDHSFFLEKNGFRNRFLLLKKKKCCELLLLMMIEAVFFAAYPSLGQNGGLQYSPAIEGTTWYGIIVSIYNLNLP